MDFMILKKEMKLYRKMKIKEGVEVEDCNYEEVAARESSFITGDEEDSRERLYFIRSVEGYTLVGYKIFIDFFDNDCQKEPEYDSRIVADTLLGIYEDLQVNDTEMTIHYHPFSAGEKMDVFRRIKENKDNEIIYPLILNLDPNKEPTWNDHWEVISKTKSEEEIVKILSVGEPHFRKHSEEVLKEIGKEKFVIYDPACSTGEFLESIKLKYPNAYTIGHDMDPKMTHIAKERLDEVECCNAFDSTIREASVDVLVLRFLNYAVVKKQDAERLFEKLIKTVKQNGMIICFGFTPVLMDAEFFEKNGLKVLGKIGYDESTDSIYQYYVMKFI